MRRDRAEARLIDVDDKEGADRVLGSKQGRLLLFHLACIDPATTAALSIFSCGTPIFLELIFTAADTQTIRSSSIAAFPGECSMDNRQTTTLTETSHRDVASGIALGCQMLCSRHIAAPWRD